MSIRIKAKNLIQPKSGNMQFYLSLFSYRVVPKKQLCKMSPVNSRKNGFTCSTRKPPNTSTSHYEKKSMCSSWSKIYEIKSVEIVLQCYQLHQIKIYSIFFFIFKWYFFFFVLKKFKQIHKMAKVGNTDFMYLPHQEKIECL